MHCFPSSNMGENVEHTEEVHVAKNLPHLETFSKPFPFIIISTHVGPENQGVLPWSFHSVI